MEILHSRLRLNRKIFSSFNVIDFQLFLSLDDGEMACLGPTAITLLLLAAKTTTFM
jgi:hypothetical protein